MTIKSLEAFNQRFNGWQDGYATQRVLDIVFGKEA